MLAARDQENLIHARQTTAAGKPLNQTTRALHPKTPAQLKTPFGASRRDENHPIDFKGQKGLGKDGPSKLDKNAFVTPAPRNRAPLGAKTTNVKAHQFQTPAPGPLTTRLGPTIQKPSATRRSGRPKIAVSQAEPVQSDVLANPHVDKEEPDFGYAPPPVVELPDPPLEYEYDPLLPQLTDEELARGYGELYFNSPKDDNGMSLRLKKEEEDQLQFQKEREQKSLEALHKPIFPTSEELNNQVSAMIGAGPKKRRPQISRVDTMIARSAALALSDSRPRLAPPATKQSHPFEPKKRSILPIKKFTPSAASVPPPTARTGRAVVSKNTIGFPKAKKAPSIIPRNMRDERQGSGSTAKPIKIDQASVHPKDFRDLYGSPPVESDMWFRLKAYELLEKDEAKSEQDDLAGDLFGADFFPFENSKLDDDDFQLPMPE